MKQVFAGALFLTFGMVCRAQPCELLTRTFAAADTIRLTEGQVYQFRFSSGQLAQLRSMDDLEKPVEIISKLQATLDQDNGSYRQQLFWQLDEKLAGKYLELLRNICPETRFTVFEKEISFYRKHFKSR